MMLYFAISILVGILIPVFYNKTIKKRLVIRGYHFHHTSHGLLTSLSSFPLIMKDFFKGVYMMGIGVGIIVHHFFSEKNLKLFDKC